MATLLLSAAYGEAFEKIRALVTPGFERYAQMHGYDYKFDGTVSSPSRPPAWQKVKLISAALEDYDEVLWLDADLVVTNFRDDIRNELHQDSDLGLVFHEIDGQQLPNTGVMLIRSNERTVDFFAKLWAQEDLVHHPWWENAAAIRLLGLSHSSIPVKKFVRDNAIRVQELSSKWNVITPSRFPEAAFFHLAGVRNELRELIFSMFILFRPIGAPEESSPHGSLALSSFGHSLERIQQQLVFNDWVRPSLLISRFPQRIRKIYFRLLPHLSKMRRVD